jgi:hypothetical protein
MSLQDDIDAIRGPALTRVRASAEWSDPPLDEHNTVSGHETGTACMWFLPALVLGMGFWAWAFT